MCLENRQVEEDKEQMQSSSERMPMGGKKWKWKSHLHIHSSDAEISLWQMNLNVTYDWKEDVFSADTVNAFNRTVNFPSQHIAGWRNAILHISLGAQSRGHSCWCLDGTDVAALASIFNHYLSSSKWTSCCWRSSLLKNKERKAQSCTGFLWFPSKRCRAAFLIILSAGVEV